MRMEDGEILNNHKKFIGNLLKLLKNVLKKGKNFEYKYMVQKNYF